jgi:hypothetical protein
VEFSRELRDDVLAGDITLSVRLWKQPRVKARGRYRVGPGELEVDAIELVPFRSITREDVRRAGEPDLETLRRRAAHGALDRPRPHAAGARQVRVAVLGAGMAPGGRRNLCFEVGGRSAGAPAETY